MKKVSIKDIAKAVGVSSATVSIVLSGKNKNGRISEAMSAKVLQVAKEMHYRPNRLAKGLQSGHSQMIGLLVADISNPFFGTLAFHIQQEMQEMGYGVIIMNTDEDFRQMDTTISLLESLQMDGYIIIPAENGENSVKRLIDANVPLVFIDRYYPSLNVQSVLIDNYNISYKAVQSLIDQKCKKIAYIGYDNRLPHMENRKKGYAEALQTAGLYDAQLVKLVHFKSLEQNMKEAVASLVSNEGMIDGVIFATNTIAFYGIRELMKLNVHIGDNLKIVCFDKSESYEFMPFDFQYILQPIAEMGKLAAHLLIQQIKDENTETELIHRLPARLMPAHPKAKD